MKVNKYHYTLIYIWSNLLTCSTISYSISINTNAINENAFP